MKEDKPNSEERADIRRQAEEVLKGKTTNLKKLSSGDVQSLVHELEVHQIELEMQNEELRRAQHELEDARNRYSDLYDFAPIGYFTFDKNGSILEVNLTGAKKLGRERGNLIKKPFSLYIHGNKDIFYSHLQKVFNTETQMTCELRLVDNKGNIYDAQLESMPVRDIDGNLLARTAMSDITGRKRAEKALRKAHDELEMRVQERTAELVEVNVALQADITERKRAEESLSIQNAVVRNMTDAVYIFKLENLKDDKSLRILFANPAVKGVEGVDPEDVVGKRLIEAFPEVRRTNLLKLYADVVRSGKSKHVGEIHYESKIVTPGEYDVRAVPLGGDCVGVIFANVTERKRNEEQIKILNEQQQTILDASPAIIVYKDKENRFIRVNEAMARAIGKSKQEVEGKTCWDLFPQEAADHYWQDDKEVIATGKSKLNIIESMETPDGTTWVQTDKILYRDSKGEIVGIIGFALDITERKRAEETLRKTEEKFRNVIENIFKFVPEGLVVLTDKLNLFRRNKAFEDLVRQYAVKLNYSEEELADILIGQIKTRLVSGEKSEIRIHRKHK